MEKQKVKIGIIQQACVADKATNIKQTVQKIEQLASKGAQIICLQELFSSLYFCDVEEYDNFKLADEIPGQTTEILQKLSEKYNLVIIASLFEKRAQGLYHNTAVVTNADGSLLGFYRKQHIPDDPGYYEKFYFAPGDEGYKVFDTAYGKVGVLVCWDQWYPEAARITSLMGAEMLFYPTAIGWADSQSAEVNDEQYSAWQTIQRAHAIANGVHVIAVNRTGKEKNMQFWGGSFIANPFGKILFQASNTQEVLHVQEIDLSLTGFYRTHWPFLRDRRIDTYTPILERFIDKK